MKIKSTQNIATAQASQRKKKNNSAFTSLFASEMESPPPPEVTSPQHDTSDDNPAKSLTLFAQASELLEQALVQLEAGESNHDETLASIQQVRQQLDDLSNQQSTQAPELSQAETLLAVEAQRIKSIQH